MIVSEFKKLLNGAGIKRLTDIPLMKLGQLHEVMFVEVFLSVFNPDGSLNYATYNPDRLSAKNVLKLAEIFADPQKYPSAQKITSELHHANLIPPAVFLLAGTHFIDEKVYTLIKKFPDELQERLANIFRILITVGQGTNKTQFTDCLIALEQISSEYTNESVSKLIENFEQALSHLYRLEQANHGLDFFSYGITRLLIEKLTDGWHKSSALECATFFSEAIFRLKKEDLNNPQYHNLLLNILRTQAASQFDSCFSELFLTRSFLQENCLSSQPLVAAALIKRVESNERLIFDLVFAYGLKLITTEHPQLEWEFYGNPQHVGVFYRLMQALQALRDYPCYESYKDLFYVQGLSHKPPWALYKNLECWITVLQKFAKNPKLSSPHYYQFVFENSDGVRALKRVEFMESLVALPQCDEKTFQQACQVLRRTSLTFAQYIVNAVKEQRLEEWFKIFLILAFSAGYQKYGALGSYKGMSIVLNMKDDAVKAIAVDALLENLIDQEYEYLYPTNWDRLNLERLFNSLENLEKCNISLNLELARVLFNKIKSNNTLKNFSYLYEYLYRKPERIDADKLVIILTQQPELLVSFAEIFKAIEPGREKASDSFFLNGNDIEAIFSISLRRLPVVAKVFQTFEGSISTWCDGWVISALIANPEQATSLFTILSYVDQMKLIPHQDTLKQLVHFSAYFDELLKKIADLVETKFRVSEAEFNKFINNLLQEWRPKLETDAITLVAEAGLLGEIGFFGKGKPGALIIGEYLEAESSRRKGSHPPQQQGLTEEDSKPQAPSDLKQKPEDKKNQFTRPEAQEPIPVTFEMMVQYIKLLFSSNSAKLDPNQEFQQLQDMKQVSNWLDNNWSSKKADIFRKLLVKDMESEQTTIAGDIYTYLLQIMPRVIGCEAPSTSLLKENKGQWLNRSFLAPPHPSAPPKPAQAITKEDVKQLLQSAFEILQKNDEAEEMEQCESFAELKDFYDSFKQMMTKQLNNRLAELQLENTIEKEISKIQQVLDGLKELDTLLPGLVETENELEGKKTFSSRS